MQGETDKALPLPSSKNKMGGNHKCPVCHATFSRPQHVGRHMRSHTGDRPYKCLYCGDQFARSDLLSRHCNKCHANEKPLPNTGSRRRGSVSTARATTSKQACDQCVQSGLSCDGSNPCAKCVQRKCKCAYVKFQRQTAPFGPGHYNLTARGPPSAMSPSTSHRDSTRMAPYPHTNDFPPGNQQTVIPSMANFFNSQPHDYPLSFAHAVDGSQLAENADIAATECRQQSDSYRRASLPLSSQNPTGPGAELSPGFYTDSRETWTTWEQENDSLFTSDNYHPEDIRDRNLQVELPRPDMEPQEALMATTGDDTRFRPESHVEHRRNLFDHGGECNAASYSVPSSAASSSVPLPMEHMNHHRHRPAQHPTYLVMAAPRHDRAYAMGEHEGGSSSAFGPTSPEEPTAQAGPPNSDTSFAMVTPRSDDLNQTSPPVKQPEMVQQINNTIPTPSKEAEIDESREFWKQYIRMPLNRLEPTEIPTKRDPPASPPASCHPRVTSPPDSTSSLVKSPRCGERQWKDETNATSPTRASLHEEEDLRSYEAAVLARKVPTTLHLGPRARRNNAPRVGTGSRESSLSADSLSGDSDEDGMRPKSGRHLNRTPNVPKYPTKSWELSLH